MRILKAAVTYFALVFGAGFALGTIRMLWIVPRLGTRMAKVMEPPFMLAVRIVVARWVVRRLAVPPKLLAVLGWAASRYFCCFSRRFRLCSISVACQ
jgi:hypothetical protein